MKRKALWKGALAILIVLSALILPLQAQVCTWETAVYDDPVYGCSLCWGYYCWTGSVGTGHWELVSVTWDDCS